MKTKFKTIFVVALLLFTLMSLMSFHKSNKNSSYGVWANKDFEILRTKNYFLTFNRSGNVVTSTLIKYKEINGIYRCEIFGKVVFKDNKMISQHVNFKMDSIINPLSLGNVNDFGQLGIYDEGKIIVLDPVEQINLVSSYDMTEFNTNNVGKCLQEWRLGIRITTNVDYKMISFEAGTNKHNYAFVVANGFTYCRAARLISNEYGTCFSQNIRLMNNDNEKSQFFTNNNLKTTTQKLIPDNNKFDSTKCFYDTSSIYWSFKNYTKDTINIHGCGEIYKIAREKKQSKTIKEWIKYVEN
jgi:hypothetical protein